MSKSDGRHRNSCLFGRNAERINQDVSLTAPCLQANSHNHASSKFRDTGKVFKCPVLGNSVDVGSWAESIRSAVLSALLQTSEATYGYRVRLGESTSAAPTRSDRKSESSHAPRRVLPDPCTLRDQAVAPPHDDPAPAVQP